MKKLALILTAIVTMSCFAGSTANAISLNIDIGDNPYYVHGGGYWAGGIHYCWYRGHWCGWRWGHRVWCHGGYHPC